MSLVFTQSGAPTFLGPDDCLLWAGSDSRFKRMVNGPATSRASTEKSLAREQGVSPHVQRSIQLDICYCDLGASGNVLKSSNYQFVSIEGNYCIRLTAVINERSKWIQSMAEVLTLEVDYAMHISLSFRNHGSNDFILQFEIHINKSIHNTRHP
mmetsp:Transcript_1604/g.4863  ORF Transcript_1604/g.4863 Transcript_1604/m.4863 type:complete len:154 (+) Transcript_1604:444-905(+)